MIPSPTTHSTLLARIADSSDQPAWREFHERYSELIRSYARKRGVLTSSLDDVVQEVLLAVQKAMTGFNYDPARGKFRGYLKAIVSSTILRGFCQTSQPARLLGDEVSESRDDGQLDEQWDIEWQQYHIRLAMRTIESEFGPADRAAFQAYAVEGRDAADTAAMLGLSPEQVYQAKSRILHRLRELIEAQVLEEG